MRIKEIRAINGSYPPTFEGIPRQEHLYTLRNKGGRGRGFLAFRRFSAKLLTPLLHPHREARLLFWSGLFCYQRGSTLMSIRL